MSEGFFPNLPFELTVDILSRLPIRIIVSCKCVCKSWLELLDSREFVKSHLSKSAPGMAVVRSGVEFTTSCEFFEFEDILDLEHRDLHYSSVTKFDFPHAEVILGSANGLLFLTGDHRRPSRDLYVCNPITRQYIKLYLGLHSVSSGYQTVTYMKEEIYPIKVFKDGDILMQCVDLPVRICYSGKTKTLQKINMFEARGRKRSYITATLCTPSFLLPKSFEMEDLRSF